MLKATGEEFLEFLPELERFARAHLSTGVYGEDEILDLVLEYAEEEFDEGSWRAPVMQVLKRLTEQLLNEQKSWPRVTDCDRLDKAFSELDRKGILTRQNYWCCTACAATAIDDEVQIQISEYGRSIWGYACFCIQDTEGAVDYGKLSLLFGASNFSDTDAVLVGKTIVATLEENGLKCDWTVSAQRRINVIIDWKRRLPPKPLLPFFRKKEQKKNGFASHYEKKEESMPEIGELSDKVKAEMDNWPSLLYKHWSSSEPYAIELRPDQLKLLGNTLRAKGRFAAINQRPATDAEIARELRVHPLLIAFCSRILRYHINDIILADN